MSLVISTLAQQYAGNLEDIMLARIPAVNSPFESLRPCYFSGFSKKLKNTLYCGVDFVC